MKEDVTDTQGTNEDPKMHRREITLADGRYMIFYTFGDEHRKDEENEQGEDV